MKAVIETTNIIPTEELIIGNIVCLKLIMNQPDTLLPDR